MDVFDTIDDLAIEEDRLFLNYISHERKTRVVRERPDNFSTWNDNEFWKRYRLKKETVTHLLSLIEDKIKHKTNRLVLSQSIISTYCLV